MIARSRDDNLHGHTVKSLVYHHWSNFFGDESILEALSVEIAINRHSNNKAIDIHQQIDMARSKTVNVVKGRIGGDKNGPVHRGQTTTVVRGKMAMQLQEQLMEHGHVFEAPCTSH